MKIIDLYERHQQQTTIMYHGTSDKYLRSILKNGLLANPPQRTHDSDANDGYETYGGVYLTKNKNKAKFDGSSLAVFKEGGNPILIVVQYVLNSGNVDEDIITQLVNIVMYDFYNKKKKRNELISILTNKALIRFKEFAKIGNPIESLLNKLFNLMLDILSFKDINEGEIIEKIGNNSEYKQIITQLMNNIYPEDVDSVQLDRDIKFSGKTKILRIENEDGKILWKNKNI